MIGNEYQAEGLRPQHTAPLVSRNTTDQLQTSDSAAVKHRAMNQRLILLVTSLAVGCSTTPNVGPRVDPTCAGDDCDVPLSTVVPRFQVDWSSERPTYHGLFRVVDESGRPVSGATLVGPGHTLETGSDGQARLSHLAAANRIVVTVKHPDHMPTAVAASYDTAGLRRHTITLIKLAETHEVNADRPITLRHDAVQWQFSRSPFVHEGGERAHGPVHVKVLAVPPAALPDSALPADDVAQASDGSTTLIREHIGLIFTEVSTLEGETLGFAPGESALLSLRLPASTRERIEAGMRLGLFSLNMEEARWIREASCEVAPMGDDSGDLACLGRVRHFSHWLVAREWDAYDSKAFGCVNMYVQASAAPRKASKPWHAHQPLQRCEPDGACASDTVFARGLRAHVPAGPGGAPSLCGVAQANTEYRFSSHLIDPETGEAHLVEQRFRLRPFASADIGRRVLEGGFDPTRDCATACQQVVAQAATGPGALKLVDADLDGYFAPPADKDATTRIATAGWDCDDDDPNTHPGAPEPLCLGRDRNCDGYTTRTADRITLAGVAYAQTCADDPARASRQTPVCPGTWNRHCRAACFEPTAEVRHNAYDEDCDGRITDRDGDGFESPADGAGASSTDCDDDDPGTFPGALEIPGNAVDENCDGIALDADNDGFFAGGHEPLAGDLGLTDGADYGLMFGDCNDHDPNVHPEVPAEKEAGQLAGLFAFEEDLPVRRLAHYCEYFGSRGNPSELFYRTVRDLNCDGIVTDADGDGLPAPGDHSLGPMEVDCDDFDPRIGAADTCADVELDELENEKQCETEGRARARAVSANGCPLLASDTPSRCVSSNEDQGLCVYNGWESGDPLRFTPGVLWGPCDGGGRLLPDCPEGSVCGAPVTYSEELKAHLEANYTDSEELEFQGMCFRTCEQE